MTVEVTVTTQRVYKVEATSLDDAKRAVASGDKHIRLDETDDRTTARYLPAFCVTGLGSAVAESPDSSSGAGGDTLADAEDTLPEVQDSWLYVDTALFGTKAMDIYVYQDDAGKWKPARRWRHVPDPGIPDQGSPPSNPVPEMRHA